MKADERACPRCAEPIKKQAIRCKHCQHDLTPAEIEAARPANKPMSKGALGCIAVVGVLAMIGIAASGGGDTPSGSNVSAVVGNSAETTNTDGDEVRADRPRFIAQYRRILDLAKPCDSSIGEVGKAAERGEAVEVYSIARAGKEACQTAWMEINRMSAGDASADATEKEEKALKTCQQAYYLRRNGMEAAMAIADGETKASKIVEMQENLKAGQAGVMLCVTELAGVAMALGIDLKDLR